MLRYMGIWALLGLFVVFLSDLILVADSNYSAYQRFPDVAFGIVAEGVDSGEKIITFTPTRLLSTVTSDSGLMASRLDRWKYALELLHVRGWLVGQGFSYHEAFSCRFVACEHFDYPHNVLLSELLLAGFMGGVFVVLIASLLFLAGVGSPEELWLSGAGMVTLLAVPSMLISGDGIFSISQAVASFFFLLLFLKGKYHLVFYRRKERECEKTV